MGTDTAQRWLDEVAAETGLDNYGDLSFGDGLEQLVASVTDEADPSPIGLGALESQVKGNLTNRLRILDWHKTHPEIDQPVAAPLFTVSLPRTGTTAFNGLLAADPANRSLRGWEAANSVPPPTTKSYDDDPRFVAARDAPDMMSLLNPEFKAIHHDPPDGPIECVTLLAQHFASLLYSTMFNIPSYDSWLLSADLRPSYRYHRQVLQVLQSECPGRWQLKSPHHALGIDALVATYPDARLIWTHRDPVKVMGSVCSLVNSLSGAFTDVEHTAYIAEHWLDLLGQAVDRLLDHEDRNPGAFCHVPYAAIVRDPVAAVAQVYEHFGLELTAEAERRLRAHAAESPKDKFGRHTYTLEGVGLRREAIEERFARYLDRFGVPDE